MTYTLKSIICHKRKTVHSGHYLTYTVAKVSGADKVLVRCDDRKIDVISYPSSLNAWPDDVKTGCYLMLYEKSSDDAVAESAVYYACFNGK